MWYFDTCKYNENKNNTKVEKLKKKIIHVLRIFCWSPTDTHILDTFEKNTLLGGVNII